MTTTYQVRDAHNRCEYSSPDLAEARKYYDLFPRRKMELVRVSYYGPRPPFGIGNRAAIRVRIDARGM